MDRIKRIIIILSILVAICIIAIYSINYWKEAKEKREVGEPGEIIDYEKEQVKQVTDKIKFYTVRNCVNTYLSAINRNNSIYYGYDEEKNQYVKVIEEKEIKQNIYNLLSQEYIQDNKVTVDNVYNYILDIKEDLLFVPLKMKVLEQSNLEKYAVYGFIVDMNDNFIGSIYTIVNLDISNKTFSVEPIKNKYNDINEITINNNNSNIEKNDNNIYEDAKLNDEYIAKEYMNSYKRIALAKPEYVYNLLDKEYRERRFGDSQGYKQYIINNKEKIKSISVSKYNAEEISNNIIQYVCIDQNNNYYIFRESAVMDYTIILDTYTVDLPEFLGKYNSANAQGKVALNIQKFMDSINNKDYKYAYSKLAPGFKSKYFPTLQSFETYIKSKIYYNNRVEYKEFKEQGNAYTYKVKLADATNQAENKIEKTFIVQLQKDTDFIISFNVN